MTLKNVKDGQRPTLAGGNPQLLSALRSLTAVFGMGTGVSFLLSPPDNIHSLDKKRLISIIMCFKVPHYYIEDKFSLLHTSN